MKNSRAPEQGLTIENDPVFCFLNIWDSMKQKVSGHETKDMTAEILFLTRKQKLLLEIKRKNKKEKDTDRGQGEKKKTEE